MTIPAILSELGYVLSVTYEIGDQSITFSFPKRGKLRMILACDSAGKNIYCIRAKTAGSKKPKNTKALSDAARRYRVWSGYDPDSYRSLKVTQRPLKKAGTITEIVYSSDKLAYSSDNGKVHEYVHKFDHKTTLKADNQEDPALMHISGSRLRVTKRGIEG